MKKGNVLILFFIIVLILNSACSEVNNSTVLKRKFEQDKITIVNAITINYIDGFVTKQVIDEEYIIKDDKNEDLQALKDNYDYIYNQPIFKFKGFKFTSEMTDTSLKLITSIDYSKINIEKLSDKAKVFCFGVDLVNDDGKLPSDSLIDYYIKEFGYTYEKDSDQLEETTR